MLLNDENISRAGNQWFEAKLIPEHKTRFGHRALSRVRSALADGINVTRNCGRVGLRAPDGTLFARIMTFPVYSRA